jgi:hypothetical protein
MADLSITATSVVKGSNALINSDYFAGETITAGQPLYLHTDNKLYKAQNTTTAKATCVGIALNGGAINQAITYQYGGTITIGATVAVGLWYTLSDTAGGLCPIADNGTADYVTTVFFADTASTGIIRIYASGVAKA